MHIFKFLASRIYRNHEVFVRYDDGKRERKWRFKRGTRWIWWVSEIYAINHLHFSLIHLLSIYFRELASLKATFHVLSKELAPIAPKVAKNLQDIEKEKERIIGWVKIIWLGRYNTYSYKFEDFVTFVLKIYINF